MDQPGLAIDRLLAGHEPVGLWPHDLVIHPLDRVSPPGGPRLHALREDLIGFGLGGNKVRKLDYLLGDAIRKGARTLITSNASSFSRNAAAAASSLGLELHVVVKGRQADHNALSRSWFGACGAHLHHTESASDGDVEEVMATVESSLAARGEAPYRLHPGGSDPIGALSYADVFRRILAHSDRTGIRFDTIVVATGSTGTQVGLLMGKCLASDPVRIVGVAVSKPAETQVERTARLCRESAAFHDLVIDESCIEIDDRFLGPGYAEPSPEGMRASEVFLRREGIVLDAVYSAKAAAALLEWARDGTFDPASRVLFIHTGGNGGMYY